jgi:hypothetical protein
LRNHSGNLLFHHLTQQEQEQQEFKPTMPSRQGRAHLYALAVTFTLSLCALHQFNKSYLLVGTSGRDPSAVVALDVVPIVETTEEEPTLIGEAVSTSRTLQKAAAETLENEKVNRRIVFNHRKQAGSDAGAIEDGLVSVEKERKEAQPVTRETAAKLDQEKDGRSIDSNQSKGEVDKSIDSSQSNQAERGVNANENRLVSVENEKKETLKVPWETAAKLAQDKGNRTVIPNRTKEGGSGGVTKK